MSQIIVPSRKVWSRQPQSLETPIGRPGLFVVDVRNALLNGRQLPTANSLTKYTAAPSGLGRAAANDSQKMYFSLPGNPSGPGPFTLFWLGHLLSANAVSYTYVVAVAGAATRAVALRHASAAYNAAFYNGSAIFGSGVNASAPGLHRLVVRGDGTTLKFDVDGQHSELANTATLPWINTLIVNGHTTGASYGLAGSPILVAGVELREWSDAETEDYCANPWQIFEPRRRVAFFDMGAGGSSIDAQATGAGLASGSAELLAQVGLAGVGVSLASGQANGSVAIPLSATGISVAGGSANGTATVRISAAGLAQAAGQAGLSASVLLAAAGAAQAAGNATLAALLNAQASGAGQASGSANLTGGAPGALSASGGDVASGSAVLSVSVQLQATGAAQASGSANGTASAPGALSASGQANAAGWATWSTLVTLTATGFVQAMGAGSFQVSIPLTAAGIAKASGAAQATLGGLVNRFTLQVREKRLTEAAASVWRVALIETNVARLTRMVHEVKHV